MIASPDSRRRLPRLIVEVRGGRSNGTKAVIDPGGSLRFGRTDIADVVVPHDDMLSGVHFDLSWDGERCRLRDRKSLKGTTLDGAPVMKAEVKHGGWIRAGKTDFLVYEEGRSAPRDEAGDEGPKEYIKNTITPIDDEDAAADEDAADSPREAERRSAAERALAELRACSAREPLYAILDAARDGRILPILRESVEKHQSLYEGVDGDALEDVAPYLAGPMRADSMLLDRLVLEGWGRRWGIYLTSSMPFHALRRHLRRFLMVEMQKTEEKVYFRFYDPDVMAILGRAFNTRSQENLLSGLQSIRFGPSRSGGALVTIEPKEAPLAAVAPLRISETVLRAYEAAEMDVFVARMIEQMQVNFPERTAGLGASGVSEAVRRGISKALGHGFRRERDVEGFLNLMFFVSPDFDTNERWARDTLAEQDMPASSKIELLYDLCQQEGP